MDDEYEISEGMLDLLFAGHETLSSVTTTAVMLLGQHKEVVEKIREELADNNVSCDSETSNCDLSYQKIVELKYVSHVVKEILRLCPPVGAVFRHVLKDFELGVCNFIEFKLYPASRFKGVRALRGRFGPIWSQKLAYTSYSRSRNSPACSLHIY